MDKKAVYVIKLSIIIPVLNAEKSISRCLNSIQAVFSRSDSFKYEVLIKDGGSTDLTLNIINEYKNYLPIQLFTGNDFGIYDAMNFGIQKSKGEFLYFMGADDQILNGITNIFDSSIQQNADIIFGNIKLFNSGKICQAWLGKDELFKRTPSHQGSIFRSSLFKEYGGFKIEFPLSADYERFLFFNSLPLVEVKYFDVLIAIFNEEGISSQKKDILFFYRKHILISQYYKNRIDSIELKGIVKQEKRRDAITLIDDGQWFWKGMLMYITTIKIFDNHFNHLRYLIGSWMKYHLS